jgi:SAM-dependent methyltransferase
LDENGIQSKRAELFRKLKELYHQQITKGTFDHIRYHANNDVIILGHVDTFIKYFPFVKAGRILDWGCLHGPDSCLLKMSGMPGNQLFGCDIFPNEGMEIFREFSGIQFSTLSHPYQLPYPDTQFDTVIGSGVIEHVVNPRESLKELHRIMKDGASLILTYAPSEYSFTEWVLRLLKMSHHRRRFTVRGLQDLLLDSGFVAERVEFHAVTPTLTSRGFDKMRASGFAQTLVDFLYKLNPFLEKFYPFNRLGQNLMVCARRVGHI